MRSLFFLITLVLAGCANQQYAGLNYGEVVAPNGERWKIAGGKDETNVRFEVTRPDGTHVVYSAENADASAVMAIQAQTINGLVERLTNLFVVPAP